MAHDLQRGAIPITLDRERILFFDMAATWLLVERYGTSFLPALYQAAPDAGGRSALKLKSMEALQYFLWAGLQSALAEGEALTLEQVGGMIHPWNFTGIFNRLVLALTGAQSTPAQPGKDGAAGQTPKTAAKTASRTAPGRSTSTRRSGLRLGR